MIPYIWKYNLKIPYSQVSRVSYNYKEGKKKNVPKSSESVLAHNIEVQLLWGASHADLLRTQPNSAWGSLTLLVEVLLNNLNHCKAWLAWHKTAERRNSEGQSQSSGWWRSRDAATELEMSQTCLHYSDMEVRNAALRSHMLWPTLQTEAKGKQILQPSYTINSALWQDSAGTKMDFTFAEVYRESRAKGEGALLRGKEKRFINLIFS